MEEWKEYKLADVCSRLRSGKGIKSDSVLDAGPYPVIGGNGIRGYANESNFKGECAVIGRQGAYCGNVRFYEGEAYMTEHAVVVVGNELADTRFLACLLSLMHLGNLSAQSAQPGISVQTLSKQIVSLPSIDYQKRVSAVIKSLDEKIEVNRRINENLEQQAQALFKSWFVDFEPFKDGEFVESELGMIPKGWRMGALGDICVTNKRSYKGDFAHEIEYIDTGSVTNNVIESTQFLNPATDKIPSRARRAVTEGDIIYSSVRPNQRHFALLFNPASNTVVSTGFVVITANWSGYRYYIYQYLIQDEIVDKLQAIAEQSVSTFPSLNAADITNLKIVIPPNDIVGDFAAICCSFIQQIEKNQQESRRLATLRDTLLPKLMSGELKVNEVEI